MSNLPKWVEELVKTKEFKKAMVKSIEDIKAGRVRKWSVIKKELGL